MGDITLRVYQAGQVEEIRPAWQHLAETQEGAGLFAAPLWVVHYWRFRRHAGPAPQLLAGFSPDGRLVGLVPLTRVAVGLAPAWLSTIRATHSTGEYPSDWCCARGWAPEFIAAVLAYLKSTHRGWFQLTMKTVPEGSPVLEAFREHCLASGLPHEEYNGFRVPIVRVDGPEADALELTSGKHRREISRRLREMAKRGELQFEEIRAPEDLAKRFEEFVNVERQGWKGREGGAIACQPDARAFWQSLATEAAMEGRLRLHLLRCGGQTVAGQLGITWGDRYYCLKLGHDERYRRFGPGTMVTRYALQCCLDDPAIRVYDFAGAARPYMSTWSTQSYGTSELAVSHPDWIAALRFRAYLYSKKRLRALRKIRLRPKAEHFPPATQ